MDLESRLRRYAQAFRREASPRPDLATSLQAGLGQRRRHDGPMAMVPAVAMAGLVLAAGLLIGYTAIQLRGLAHPSPTPPISLTTASPSPTATASPTESPTPAPTPTPRAAGAPMQVIDVAFVDTSHGWAIGTSCPQTDTCPLQLRISDDGGRSWFAGNAPNIAALGNGATWQIRFGSSQVGWLYGPQLFRTTDGGQSWTRVNLGHSVLSLAPSGNSVWAIAADCSQGRCARMAVYRSGDQGATWSRASAQPGMVGQGVELLRVSDGTLWVVCGGDHAMGQMRKQVIISRDGGLHWSFPPDMPLSGYNSDIALAGDAHAWVATVHGPLYESTNSGASWQTATSRGVVVDLAGAGVSRVLFLDSQHGWAATDHAIFWTSDGGAHWGRTAI